MESIELSAPIRHSRRLIAILLFLVAGGILHAQTGGPIQKEATGGAPSSGVDDFSGSFSYAIPLLTVPGPNGLSYPITLSYRSGESPDAGVSWVGYGWSLNPGAIVRDQKGLPDDWVGNITYYNKVKDNWTVTAQTTANLEVTSFDVSKAESGRYNSYFGYTRMKGAGVALKGLGSLAYTEDDDGHHFSGAIGPSFLLTVLNYLRNNSSSSFKGPYPSPTIQFSGKSYNYSHSVTFSIPPFLLGINYGDAGSYTWQHSDEVTPKEGHGYMYSGTADESHITDYHLDKDMPYYKGNQLLPIPFVDADNFIGTGNGYRGAFRLYSSQIGQFGPTASQSSLNIEQLGAEITVGGRLGIGGDFGTGNSTLSVGRWSPDPAYKFPSGAGPRDFMFIANGDMGASAEYASSDAATRASINATIGATLLGGPVVISQTPSIPSSIYPRLNGSGRANRSTFIGFASNTEMNEETDKGFFFKGYSRDPDIRNLVNRYKVGGIGEISVTDASGNRMVYGLPVYSRNESRISYGLEGLAKDQPGSVHANFSAYTPASLNYKRVIGTVQTTPYASSFLLTEMTTSDYVDRTFNGPSPDDYGGYVKFNYVRAAGDPDKTAIAHSPWYYWRMPYRGLSYTKGSLSDPDDDLGSFSAGEREMYYIQSIETKTHIAFFVTNTTDTTIGGHRIRGSHDTLRGRWDGFQGPLEVNAVKDSNASGAIVDIAHPNFSRKLERIELYAKNAAGKPDSLLSTVFLEYDYSLRPGMPNSLKDTADTTKRVGMLTLKKLWFQNQSIVNARIAPFTFGYRYPDSIAYPKAFRNSHPEIARFGTQYVDTAQNPSYSEFDADPWGSYQYNGRARYAQLRNWVNQAPDSVKFDPAAWQLKTIHMPSGGETRIQYEQNDYGYVQDRPASAMVSLVETPNTGFNSLDDDSHAQYYLNLADIGVPDSSHSRVAKVANMVKTYFLNEGNKIYFKLHYSLLDHTSFTNPEYTSDYINGYGNLTVVRLDTIATTPYKRYGVIIEIHGDGDFNVPRKICRDFVKKNRRGKFDPSLELPNSGDASDRVAALESRMDDIDFNESHYCQELDFANSYVRIPLPANKLGGGIRVKRLLSFDPGIESDSAMYGTEYVYTTFDAVRNDTISSGVAVNEPAVIREENALFAPWPDKYQNPDIATKLVFARDKDQYEGPIAKSLLPGASVGYSRVTKRNIHTGESNPGFSVISFYTAKDYPLIGNYPAIGNSVDFTDILSSFPQQVNNGISLIHTLKDNLWLTQGFRFILNSMHGQLRSTQTYGGNWNNKDSWHLSSSTEYTYFEPGEKVPVIDSLGDSIRYESPGKRMDVAMDDRQIEDVTNDANIEGDLTFFIPFDIQPSASPSLDFSESRFHSFVTSKVVRYPAIAKGVLTYRDGTYNYARTVAIDRISGQPVISESTDGYNALADLPGETGGHNGLYHAMMIPAFHVYPGMGPKANSERLLLNPVNPKIAKKVLISGRIVLYRPVVSGVSVLDSLTPGDLISLKTTNGTTDRGFYHVSKRISGDTAELLPVSTSFAAADTLSDSVQVEVIRSGRTNQLGVSVGSVTTYGLTAAQLGVGSYRTTSGGKTLIANAVNGGAVLLRDSVAYDMHGIDSVLPLANPYELGRRGRWRMVTSYSYRRPDSGGSKHDLYERTWRRAGIIDTFALFDWRTPSSNDTTVWLRGDSIALYSYEGMPLESYDPIHLPSATHIGYKRMLPIASASIAKYDQIFFSGFEEDSGSANVVRMHQAHSGEYCLRVLPSSMVTIDSAVTWTDSLSNLVLRYWRRNGGDTAAPSIRVKTPAGHSTYGTRSRIASTGAWTLYEAVFRSDSITLDTNRLRRLSIEISGSSSSDTIYVDDLRAGPADAVMACSVFDPKTYRSLVTFDANHFGTYSQYNAEGRLIRQIAETVEGIKTVTESHGHIPLTDRTPLEGGPSMAMRGPSPGAGRLSRMRRASSATSASTMGAQEDGEPHTGTSFDIIDLKAGPDGNSLKVFGLGLPNLDSLSSSDLGSLGLPSVPLLEKRRLLDSLLSLDRQTKLLDSISSGDVTPGEKRMADEKAAVVRQEWQRLLEKLGLTEEEWVEAKRQWSLEQGANVKEEQK